MAAEVVILTCAGDAHACAVDYVLTEIGVNSSLVNLDSLPCSAKCGARYQRDGSILLQIGSLNSPLDSITSSWNRRVVSEFDWPDTISAHDAEFVNSNLRLFVKGVVSLLDDKFPVNQSSALFASANKLRQLRIAEARGLLIPKTLVSDNSAQIFEFLDAFERVCVKPYVTYSWATQGGLVSARNAILTRSMVDDFRSLEIMPNFYQEFIEKKAEYRLTIFGDHVGVSRIDTASLSEKARLDWRSSYEYLQDLTAVKLPDKLISSCKNVLRDLGLRFGTIDLIENTAGDFYFLEVNQAGQWLWQELHSDNCKLLEPFARYLASANDSFAWDANCSEQRFSAAEVMLVVEKDSRYSAFLDPPDHKKYNLYADER